MKTKRKVFAVLAVLAFLLGTLSPISVFASAATNQLTITFRDGYSDVQGYAEYSLDDGANWNKVTGNITDQAIMVTGDNLRIRIVANGGYSVDWTGISYREDNSENPLNLNDSANSFIADGLTSGDGYRVTSTAATVELAAVEFRQEGGNPQPGPGGGNTQAVINLSGPEGSWTGETMVFEPVYQENNDGTFTIDYQKMYGVVMVGINGSNRTNYYGYGEAVPASQYVQYNKEDGATLVDMEFFHNWGYRIESVKINDIDFTNEKCVDQDNDETTDDMGTLSSIYDSRYSWLNHFQDQGFKFTIKNVPVADIYNIELKVRPITPDECYIGNFLWSNDDYFAPEDMGGVEPNDLYIGHSNLTLISVDFNDGDPDYDFEANGGYKHLDINATEGEAEVYPYVHYQLDRMGTAASSVEVATSEMVIPEGSWVTMKIEPHYGYQVKSFSGVGQDDIDLGGTSVFSFKVGKGNFHIGAQVEEQEDDAAVESKAVTDAGVILAEGTLDTGSARLYVEDAEISSAKETAFEAEAKDGGYVIASYVDINLSQVFFQGTGNDQDVWANPMEDLDQPATVGLALDGLGDGDDVVLIHNIHDGDKFEVIEAEYNEEYGVFTFETDSFSNYAIATKSSSSAEADTKDTTNEADTKETTSKADTKDTTNEATKEETTSKADTEAATTEVTTEAASTEAVNESKSVKIADGAPKTTLNTDSAALIDALLTDAEKEAVKAGAKVDVYLTVEDVGSKISEAEKKEIGSVLAQDQKVGAYIDIDLFKQVGDNSPVQVGDTKGTKLSLSVDLPDNLVNIDTSVERSYSLVRVHDGVAEVIPCTYDAATKKLTFSSEKFSVYAIVYKDAEVKKAATNTSPKTGDTVQVAVEFIIGLFAALGFAVFAAKKREMMQ